MSPAPPLFKKDPLIFRLISNKYFLTALAFAGWSLFFDQNDWVAMEKKKKELDGLKSSIKYLEKEIRQMDDEREALLKDPVRIEQYARETYRMKRPNEDVYVIEGGK